MTLSRKPEGTNIHKRQRFPDDEAKLFWLPMLLDAYAIIDEGIAIAIKEREEENKMMLACKRGCVCCCHTHTDIPVYPLELVGIYWYCTEKMKKELRIILKERFIKHGSNQPCPFLIDSSCSIYPVRPVSCRQFNVFNKPCESGEDPYYTRRNDVLTPLQDYTDSAFSVMLPFYGITAEADKLIAIKNNFIHAHVCNLQLYKWTGLIEAMEDFDSKNP